MNDELLLKARELLAVEYDRGGYVFSQKAIRSGEWDDTVQVRAIIAALKSAQPVAGRKGEPVWLRDLLSAKMHHLPVEDQHVLSVILDANPQPAGDGLPTGCMDALCAYQQADKDGVMVLVSREALDTAIAALRQPVTSNVQAVLDELERATRKFPTWPTDPLHAVGVLGEEFGELTKAVLQTVYEPHKSNPEDVATEAIQTAAMAMRFIDSLPLYSYTRAEQHSQKPGIPTTGSEGEGK